MGGGLPRGQLERGRPSSTSAATRRPRTSSFNERVAGDDGRAGPHPPGARHPRSRRADRGARDGSRPGSSRTCWSSSPGPTARSRASPRPPVHDPCAVAFVIDPGVLTTRRAPLDVELHGTLTTGMTVADLRGPEPADCHTRVAVTLDSERFWDLVVDALVRIGDP